MTEFMQKHGALVIRVSVHITRDVMREELQAFAIKSPVLKNPESLAWARAVEQVHDAILARLEGPLDAPRAANSDLH